MSDDPRTMTDEEAMIQSITGHSIYASNQANWHFLMYKLVSSVNVWGNIYVASANLSRSRQLPEQC